MSFEQHLVHLQNGTCDGFVLVKRSVKKTAKNGSTYLDMILAVKDDEISAKFWNFEGENNFTVGKIIKVRGLVEDFNGKDQFRIINIRETTDHDNFNPADIVPASQQSGEDVYNYLLNKARAFKDEDLKRLVVRVYTEKKDKLIVCPAAYKLHHAMLGGLMLHTASIVSMCEKAADVYPDINRELLIAGAMLHDVEKTDEFNLAQSGMVEGYSERGELLGHIVMGAAYVDRVADELKIPERKKELLEHMILSHHNVPEFGSPVRPMFLEAFVLATLDNMDASIYEFTDAESKLESGAFSDRQWSLDNRKLFNPGINEFTNHKINLD